MLDGESNGVVVNGVRAIYRMALCLDKWVSQEGFRSKGGLGDFPIDRFLLDVGRSREGYGRYCRRVEEVLGETIFVKIAEEFERIASCWDTVGSMRNLYEDSRASESCEIAPEFIIRKLGRLPSLINMIAEMETQALLGLRQFMRNGGYF
jgi:hypothetical protein